MITTTKKINYIIRNFLLLVSLCLVFISGSFSTDVKIEDVSFYSAQVVKNNTISKKNLSLSVRSNDKSGALPNWESEFHSLYGSFREREITFASTINAKKTINLKIADDTSIISDCVSLLYFGPVGTIRYPVQNPTHFKHYVLPMELMFEDNKSIYDINKYIINISQSQANKILFHKGLEPQPDGNYLEEQYQSIIKTDCILVKDDIEQFKVCINNIYLEENYYYEGLNETIKEFVMVSYYLPWNLRNEQENCYFLTDSAYQNDYFMKHINAVYEMDRYSISIIKNNVVGVIDEMKILSFNTKIISSSNWLSTFLLVFSILFIALICFSNIKFGAHKLIIAFLEFVYLLVPYALFFIIFRFTNNLLFFSSYSCLAYLFIVIAYIIIFISFVFIRINQRNKITNYGDSIYEVDI